MEKEIKIESVEVKKEGTNPKTNKNWTLYTVKCSGDSEMTDFSTFDFKYKDSVGQTMKSNFEYNDKFRNWNEISGAKAEENSKHDELLNALRQLYDKVDEVGKKIDALGVPRTTEEPPTRAITDEELQQDEANSQYK